MFTLSDEQIELGRTVRAFLEQKSPEAEVRRLMETELGYDAAVWEQMTSQLGLPGLGIPEQFGGSGATHRDVNVVLEEMGRALLCAPYLATAVLAVTALLESGDLQQQQALLPGIAAGATIATVAVTEGPGAWTESSIAATAIPSGAGWLLSGTKRFVLDGMAANLLLVAARTSHGVSLFAVTADASGLTRRPLLTMDLTRKLADVEFDAVPATLVGSDGGGWRVLEATLRRTVVALAAEQIGGAQRCLETAVEYAKNRIQFGRPIGSFQAVKHRCADMLLAIEIARSAAVYASDCPDEDLAIAAAMAKSSCSEAYYRVAADTIQVHGGIGFTWEHAAHLYFKRATSSELLFGTPRHHRALLARELGLRT